MTGGFSSPNCRCLAILIKKGLHRPVLGSYHRLGKCSFGNAVVAGVVMKEARSMDDKTAKAIDKLGADFPHLNWNFLEKKFGEKKELVSQWLGGPDEDIMVCVFKGKEIHEKFHRQDFFFINYAYTGDYGAQSYRFDNHVTIKEDECYIGQPYSGYALYGAAEQDIVIVGILIRKEVFYRSFLPAVSLDRRLLHFFLDPEINSFSEEFIHLKGLRGSPIRSQIEMMAIEYANKTPETQNLMKPMALSLILMLARQFREATPDPEDAEPADKFIAFMEEHLECASLPLLGERFGYNPAYISSLISKKKGKTFSEILLSLRMERAVFLMANTDLSIEEMTPMLGYQDKSNFHRAFKGYYGDSPRHYAEKIREGKTLK
jgi:AraC-like DNA-binding protein